MGFNSLKVRCFQSHWFQISTCTPAPRCKRTRKRFVVKQLSLSDVTPEEMARIDAESALLREASSHPNVVRFYGTFKAGIAFLKKRKKASFVFMIYIY